MIIGWLSSKLPFRATGIGLSMGAGRLGSFLGPLLAGQLFDAHLAV